MVYWNYRRQRQSTWTTDCGTGKLGIPIRHQGRTLFTPVVRPPIRNHITEAPCYLGTLRISGKPAVQEGADPSTQKKEVLLDNIVPPVGGSRWLTPGGPTWQKNSQDTGTTLPGTHPIWGTPSLRERSFYMKSILSGEICTMK